jgi:hypothetical protein
MLIAGLVIFGVMALLGGAFWLVAAKTRVGTLPPNGWVGIRIPATMKSPDAWYAGHRAAVSQTFYGAVVCWVVAVGALVEAALDGPGWVLLTLFFAGSVLILVLVIWSAVVAARAASSVTRD